MSRERLFAALAVNLPFLLARPEAPWLDAPPARTLAIGLALLAAPGLPLASLALRRREAAPLGLLWVLSGSALAGAAAALAAALAGRAGDAGAFWSALWLAANAALLARETAGGAPWRAFLPRKEALPFALALFAAAYAASYYAATRVVPPMEDHDYETQGTGWGLLTRGRPELKTDRGTELYFAHPPLLHLFVAESFLAWDRAGRLRAYAREGASVDELYAEFRADPATLPTRTPNLLLAALAAALVGTWAARLSGRAWLGALAAAVYATSPEVFVRSGYGGYFAIGQLAALALLLADAERRRAPGADADRDALLAGAFAALADHKLVLLPLALAAWDWARAASRERRPAALHPAAKGFALAYAAFWAWGLSVDAGAFWLDHARSHLLDRLAHRNPLGYGGYPGPLALWLEFARNTGWLLLPLGAWALAADARAPGERDRAGAWAVWVLLAAAAFTAVDWRQTKHLMPLLPALLLAPARRAALDSRARRAAAAVLVLLAAWNGLAAWDLCRDFASFAVTPAW